MFWRYLLFLVIVIGSTSCSEKRSVLETTGDSAMLSRQEAKYLAYEHSLTVDVKEESLSQTYESTLYACVNDKGHYCPK